MLEMITHSSILLMSFKSNTCTTHMPTQTFCISHLPLSSNNSWYQHRYSVSEQAKSIGIGSMVKLWHRSHPKELEYRCVLLHAAEWWRFNQRIYAVPDHVNGNAAN